MGCSSERPHWVPLLQRTGSRMLHNVAWLVSLDFCCIIQMAGSEFGLNTMKVLLVSIVRWCDGVGAIFLPHFGPLCSNWASFKCHSLPDYCLTWPCLSLKTTVENFLMATSNRMALYVAKHKSSPNGFSTMTLTSLNSNAIHSHQNSINCWHYHVSVDQNVWQLFI